MIKSLNFNCLLPFCYKYITVEEHHKGRHTSWSVVFWSFSFEWASIMERLANRLTPLVSWSSPTNRWLTGDFSTSVGLTNSTTVISMLVVAIISGSWFEQLQTDIAEHFNPSLQLQQNYPKWAVGYNCTFLYYPPTKVPNSTCDQWRQSWELGGRYPQDFRMGDRVDCKILLYSIM